MIATFKNKKKDTELKGDKITFSAEKNKKLGISNEQNMKQTERINLTKLLNKTGGVKEKLNKNIEEQKEIEYSNTKKNEQIYTFNQRDRF